ncbi:MULTISPECIES: response regulator [Aureimonas]|uniref:Two-component system, chemotaxis family, response regulator CheY n=1 Tax=Aureimonas jatrophae TaxID=1166073 RepID=A0A1H0CU35_9HYPH|nr:MULTISPECIES: response regulator [Aureimonas]MBB3951648.1 two-component system chemotaxis response regulator CheY [Aureimonas jatrophae]SDN61387.1 two-component system, chemotaxis family, response regulator CheY [Aureimonas jatrophae]
MTKSVLCVDDSASVRQMVSFTLESAGYAPDTAVDGADAITKLEQNKYQLIITDLNMPNLDGIGMIRKVRQMPQHAGLPIVMLTTESDEAKKMEGKAAGATGWIVKPFDQTKLVAVVNKLIGA